MLAALSIHPGACVAVVGAGGKTALCWRLVQQLSARGRRAVFTTTTHVRRPAPGAFDRLIVEPDIDSAARRLLESSDAWSTACLAAAVEGDPDETPAPDSLMPVVHTKLTGFAAADVCRLQSLISNPQSPISVLVEADGARGRWIKAPAEHEPAIPGCADAVCVVAHLGAVGLPLDERVAHRPRRIAELAAVQPGTVIDVPLLVGLLTHPQAGLKGIPTQARRLAVLTQRCGEPLRLDVAPILAALTERGYDAAMVVDLGLTEPVLAARARLRPRSTG